MVKEISNGMYTAASYVVSQGLVQSVFLFILAVAGATPAYWIGGPLNDNGERYILYVAMFFAFLYVVESFVLVVGSAISDFIVTLVVANSLLTIFFVMDGVFVSEPSIPLAWR